MEKEKSQECRNLDKLYNRILITGASGFIGGELADL
jgi:nucleoside-diphosphate-sugar epimerase